MNDENNPRPAGGNSIERDLHPEPRGVLPPGTPAFFGEYETWRVLGNGTFGRVFLARDPEMKRYVAIKAPIHPLPLDQHRGFLREARMISTIHHPNICPVHHVGTQGEWPFIVMRYVKGTTLGRLILRDPPTPTQALRFAEQIANGLQEAHENGVFHRDLKPANVLHDEKTRNLLITDFGVARGVDATHTLGGTPGTPLYMAPEQWGPGPFGPISARSDVYSLGVLLFRLLTGIALFPGETASEQMFGHCTTPPRRLSDVRPDLEWLDDLVVKAVAKQQSERYGSAKEFADAIADHLRPAAIPTVPPVVIVSPPPLIVPSPPPVEILRPGETRDIEIAPGVLSAFCWIPPGTATLGSPSSEKERLDDELEHDYTCPGFWMGKYTVTQAEWKAVMGSNPSYFDGKKNNNAKGKETSRFPVESVSWNDICGKDGKGGFLAKVNALGGNRKAVDKPSMFALPHEDMWEYACRGGLGNARPFYFGDSLNGTEANMDGNYPYGTTAKGRYLARTCAVDETNDGKYKEHPWKLMHMHGNVWELCENKRDQTNECIVCGGSWFGVGCYCRAAYRNHHTPDYAIYRVGFRLCIRLA